MCTLDSMVSTENFVAAHAGKDSFQSDDSCSFSDHIRVQPINARLVHRLKESLQIAVEVLLSYLHTMVNRRKSFRDQILITLLGVGFLFEYYAQCYKFLFRLCRQSY